MSSDKSGYTDHRPPNSPVSTIDEAFPPVTPSPTQGWTDPVFTAAIVLQDGTILKGYGLGAAGQTTGELCFNTAMTGYQEILTDPSYAGQIITFTFPHIGNVGTNDEDIERDDLDATSGVRGCVLRASITGPSNYRATQHLNAWLDARGIIGICGIDTRALTTIIREKGMPNAIIVHEPNGKFDFEALKVAASNLPNMEGLDLAKDVKGGHGLVCDEGVWVWNEGHRKPSGTDYHVVALDFGMKQNILRCLATAGCKVTVLPATATAEEVLALRPDGVFLSNGAGDPAAMKDYAVQTVRKIVDTGLPVFGICLGHQLLALALGAATCKMRQGHHGANHPVKDRTTGKVEITSMNHGFTVDPKTLPADVEETHVSLFDGTNCGIRVKDRPVFSVQYHPEASPGPQDSHYLFRRFINNIRKQRQLAPIAE
jgi:carbamoyl-phosphate synthase small subunit